MNDQWIPHPTILIGETVELVPLENEHLKELYAAASDKKLWENIPVDCSNRETFERIYSAAISEREKRNQYPFMIIHKQSKKIIGSTRFFEIYPNDKKLEIGWTWIITQYWATEVNLECKLLLLRFCFDVLKCRRVQLKTDQYNLRSRKAIEKIGGKFEGILRKDRIKENGVSRSAAYYSIIDDEWNEVKENLTRMLEEKRKDRG